MSGLTCVGCGDPVHEDRLVVGNRFQCENCADVTIEVFDRDGRLTVRQIHFASCPVCEERLEVPPGAAPGRTMTHCGRTFQLTYDFGAYALE